YRRLATAATGFSTCPPVPDPPTGGAGAAQTACPATFSTSRVNSFNIGARRIDDGPWPENGVCVRSRPPGGGAGAPALSDRDRGRADGRPDPGDGRRPRRREAHPG